MDATVQGEVPDLEPLKKLIRDKLRDILEGNHGEKDLFIDANLMKPIDRIADIRFLRDHGVDKIYKLDSSKAVQGRERRFYLTRPIVSNIKLVVEQVKAERSLQQTRSYTLVMIPRSLYVCEKVLEEQGVMGYVKVESLPLHMLPIDRDIISMELDFFYTSVFLNRDETWNHCAASSIVSLQEQYGVFRNVSAIGQCSKNTWDLSQTLLEYRGVAQGLQSSIGHIILLDRDVDMVTPLCSQVTYEGLLDDIFGINCGVVEFDKEVTQSDKSVKIQLNSSDEVFEEIRNKHFSTVFRYLSAKAQALQRNYDKKDGMSVQQMKDFVANDLRNLKAQHRSLTLHISACEVITKRKTADGDLEDQLATEHGLLESHEMNENMKYIEEQIYQQKNKINTLRLMCLLSLVKDGLPPDRYEHFRNIFLQSHGYQHIADFHNLAKLGLFTKKQTTAPTTMKLPGGSGPSITLKNINIPTKSSYQQLSKNLHLIPKNASSVDLKNPTDMSYVFSGAYIPLSCKLVELILSRRGLGNLEENIKLITSSYYSNVKPRSARVSKQGGKQPLEVMEQTVLVCFLGGVTYSEIASLRFLGHVTGVRFLILTTSIINGNRFISKLIEPS